MFKNRTVVAISAFALALAVVFGVFPLAQRAMAGRQKVVVLTKDIAAGTQITESDVSVSEMGSVGLPNGTFSSAKDVVGKYAVTGLFKNSLVLPAMLSETIETADNMLRSLGLGESDTHHSLAMSVPIKSYEDGLSGKLLSGDIITIVSIDGETKAPVIYDELRYIEVLTATTKTGADNINGLAKNQNDEYELPVTLTLKLQDESQALRLTTAEQNGTLQAIFVCRDEARKLDFLQLQADALAKIDAENEENTDESPTGQNSIFPPVNGIIPENINSVIPPDSAAGGGTNG